MILSVQPFFLKKDKLTAVAKNMGSNSGDYLYMFITMSAWLD